VSAGKAFFASGVPDDSATVATAVRRALRPRASILTLGALGALGSMTSGAALAADAPETPSDDSRATLSEVVVTGIRYQLESSQLRKQNATEIVDSITATDIGALPDRSVTEVLQRIPGLAIGRIPDPRDADRIQTEGSGVTIRGLGWVLSELNGRSVFSAKSSRVLGFEDIPPELLAGVDVYKNPSAEQIEGGVSGAVDLRTRLPFDAAGRKFGFTFEEQRGDLAKVTKPTASVLYSDRLDTGIGDLGVLVSATNSQLVSRTNTLSVDQYYPRTDLVPGQTVYATGGVGFRTLTLDRERTGISSALQWRSPEKTVDASLQYFYSHATFDEDEDALPNTPGQTLSGKNLTFTNGLLTGGMINDTAGWNGDARYTKRESNNDDLSLHVNWRPADRWHLETDIQHSKAVTKGYDLTVGTNYGPNYESTDPWGLQLNGSNLPTITLTDSSRTRLADPNLAYTSFAMDYHNHNNADAWAYRADGDYTFDSSSWLDKVRFGVRYENYKATTREADYNWGSVSFPWGGGTQVATATAFQNTLPYFIQTFPNWFHGGSAPTSYPFVMPGALHNFASFVNIYNQLCAAGVKPCGWTPFNGDYGNRLPTPGALGVNPQSQKTYAGYGQLSFKHGQFDGNVGVRLVHTNTAGTAFLKFDPFPNNITGIPADIQAFSNGGALTQTGGISYTDALPSFNLRYKATEKVYLRFAVDKAITRPDFSQLSPSIEIAPKAGLLVGGVCTPLPSTPGIIGNCLYRYTGNAGNANLKPMHAWNFDLSAEWYISDTNSLVGALFDKEISGFLEPTFTVVPYTNNGVTQNVLVTRPENQGKGHVRGFETAWNGVFEFLPGFLKNFGARTSFTYVTSAGTRNSSANPYDPDQVTGAQVQGYPLQGLSKRTYNAELYYSVQQFEARLAYNWRSRYVLTTDAANIHLPVWTDDYGQLDASVQWRFLKHLTLGVEAVNLTDTKVKELVDNMNGAGLTYHNWVDSDRRYGVYLRGAF
jgi:TonB-dependent receptor